MPRPVILLVPIAIAPDIVPPASGSIKSAYALVAASVPVVGVPTLVSLNVAIDKSCTGVNACVWSSLEGTDAEPAAATPVIAVGVEVPSAGVPCVWSARA